MLFRSFSGFVTRGGEHVGHRADVSDARVACKTVDECHRAFSSSGRIAGLMFGQKVEDALLHFIGIEAFGVRIICDESVSHKCGFVWGCVRVWRCGGLKQMSVYRKHAKSIFLV